MQSTEKILERIKELIKSGDELCASAGGIGRSDNYLDESLFFAWKARSFSLLQNVFGMNHVHYIEFEKGCDSPFLRDAYNGQGILRAAKDDIEFGYLGKVEDLISADIFSDFLEMADYLVEKGYKDPAASLTGAVLEDGLKRVCFKNSVEVKKLEGIDSLNKKLYKNER